MAETLGSLCDKLTVLELKRWHSNAPEQLESLARQVTQLQLEIDGFVADAASGAIPPERLCHAANKVYRPQGNAVRALGGSIGVVFAQLAQINCALWHEQEKVYEFERVPVADKDRVVKQLAVLNLERNQCIDAIDRALRAQVTARNHEEREESRR